MDRIGFGQTGLEVSRLGFGAAPIGYLETEARQVEEVLNALLDLGANVIDTAACYPGSEEAIGRAVARRRDEYVLVTKCGHQVGGLEGPEWSAGLIRATVEQALRRLKTDRVDVMLLHSCSFETLEHGEALEALVEARTAGKVRWVGYSGDNEAAALAARHPEVAVLETSVSICDQRNIDLVLPVAREHGVGVLAKRPIANAAWKDPSNQPGLYSSYAQTYTDRLAQMKVQPEDLGFPGPPDEAWPEIALRFTLSVPGVHSVLVGTTDPVHVRRNIELAKQGALPAAAVDQLRRAFQRAQQESGAIWSGQT